MVRNFYRNYPDVAEVRNSVNGVMISAQVDSEFNKFLNSNLTVTQKALNDF